MVIVSFIGIKMKKQLLTAISIASVLTACTEALEVTPEVKEEGVYATIEQPVSANTRSLAYENDKLVFTWGEGENVMAIGDGDVAMFRTVNPGESSSQLESKGFQLIDDATYYAYIPAKSLPVSEKEVPVTFLGQRQVENNNSSHLKDFDYACAAAAKDAGSNSLRFTLENQVGWIILEHTFAEATKIVSVTIEASEDIFVTEGTLDVTTSTISESARDSKITLALGEKDGKGLEFATGGTFRGFFTVAPVDLSGKALSISAVTEDGGTLNMGTFTRESANIAKNRFGAILTEGTAVAKVEGKEYSTLTGALSAAPDGATISVVSDIKTEKLFIDKSVTFDLGGNTVSADDDVFYIAEDGLTVNFKNGNIVSTKYGGLFFKQGCQNENITFDNCNITGVEGAIATSTLTGSTITINGGTYVSSNNAVILTNGNKLMFPNDVTNTAERENPNNIIINGGTFKGQMSDEAYDERNSIACGIYAAWKDNIIVNDGTFEIEKGVAVLCRGGKVTIKGGTFTTTDPDKKTGRVGDSRIVVPCKTVYLDKASQYPDYENAKIEISGGRFSDDACKDYLAEGYGIGQVYDQSKNMWYYEVAKAVAEYNGVKYCSLQSAIDASEDATNEITILEDVTVSALTVYSNNKVTINLNGKSVNVTGNSSGVGVVLDSGNLTIKGSGKFGDLDQKNVSTLFYVDGGVFDGGTLTIEGDATYYSTNECAYARKSTATIKINGGKWMGGENFTLNKNDKEAKEAVISVTGGEFYKYNPSASHSENPVANFVAEGYGVVKSGDWYKVVKATEVADEASLSSAIGKTSKSPVMVNSSVELNSNVSIASGNTLVIGENGKLVPSTSFKSGVTETVTTANKKGVINISGNGSIVAPSNITSNTNGSQAIFVQATPYKTVTVNIYGNLEVYGGSGSTANHAIAITNGTVNIYGGHFSAGLDKDGKASDVILLRPSEVRYQKAALNIYDGVFETVGDSTFLINCKDNDISRCTIKIMGGIFVGFNPADSAADKIDGKNANWVPDGYKSTQTTYNGKTAWVVTKE